MLKKFKVFENIPAENYYGLPEATKEWIISVSYCPDGKDPGYELDSKTGEINARCDFDICESDLRYVNGYDLSIPRGIKFGVVDGDFLINSCGLKDTDGLPREVTGEFSLDRNKISSLVGGPLKAGSYYCSWNELKNLEGSPIEVEGNFECSSNPLESLKGFPKKIGGTFTFSRNHNGSDPILIKNCTPAGRFEYLFDCDEWKRKLIISSFDESDIDTINKEIKKNPGKYILIASKMWNLKEFKWIRDLLEFPEGSEDIIKGGSDMAQIGF